MAQKLAWLVTVFALAIPACAGQLGTISGYVKDSSGVPQMGAMVQLLGSSTAAAATAFTDPRGFYSVSGLPAGVYEVKVSAPSFLPSLREHVSVRSGAGVVINVTLNTLFEALQMMPAKSSSSVDDEDWKWTLRSMANRPVLRMVDDGPLVVVSRSDRPDDKVLKARVAFVAGSDTDGFGGTADMTTSFNVERSIFSAGTISLDGNVGYSGGVTPGAVVRATYSHRMADGSVPEVSFTARRFATPELASHGAVLQALALAMSDSFSVANFVDLNVGSELQSVQFLGGAGAVKPFGSVDVHLSPNTVLEYKYTTSEPNMRATKGFDSAPADLSESGPRMSLANWNPVLERAHHQEVSVSRRLGPNSVQLAFYSDRIVNPALIGIGDVDVESGAFFPDLYSGTFTYGARELSGNGLRAVYQRKLTSQLIATLDYAYGPALDLTSSDMDLENAGNYMRTVDRHSLSYKMSGTVPHWKTRWLASYKWMSGPSLTPLDLFNSGPGQADPFLNVFLRQPIPTMGFLPGHMEALVDVRNLLAQGYIPVVGQDGHTVYLVQSARSVRGGVSFSF
jgi:hypothetical protein